MFSNTLTYTINANAATSARTRWRLPLPAKSSFLTLKCDRVDRRTLATSSFPRSGLVISPSLVLPRLSLSYPNIFFHTNLPLLPIHSASSYLDHFVILTQLSLSGCDPVLIHPTWSYSERAPVSHALIDLPLIRRRHKYLEDRRHERCSTCFEHQLHGPARHETQVH